MKLCSDETLTSERQTAAAARATSLEVEAENKVRRGLLSDAQRTRLPATAGEAEASVGTGASFSDP